MENEKFLRMWHEIRDFFEQKFNEYDEKWITRERKISTKFLVLFIIRLVIPKDERGYANTLLEVFNNFIHYGIEGQPKMLAPSSVCEARMKLDPQIFKELSSGVIKIWDSYSEKRLWHGLRLYSVDGSKITLARELLDYGFKKEGEHTYYPKGLLSSANDLLTGLPCDYSFVSHGDERMCALDHLKYTEEGSLHLYDRGYFSFEMLAAHRETKKEAIFRLQTKVRISEIDNFWDNNETDKEVLIFPTERFSKKIKKGLCCASLDPIRVRLIKYTIEDKTYVLLTTLLDREKYPESVFKEVYHFRWGHEEMIKVSKVITGVIDLHSKTERGVKQELFAHFLIIVLLKIIELQAQPQKKEELKNKKPPLQRIRRLDVKMAKDNLKKEEIRNWPDLRNGIQLNQKTIFLLLSWTIEKILYVNSMLGETITYLVDSAKKVSSVFRPGREYPRRSRTPPSKFWRARKA